MSAISRVQLAIAMALVTVVGAVVLVMGVSSVEAQPPLNGGGGWTSYPDPNENTGISGQRANGEIIASPDPWNSLTDIAAAFANARVIENSDLCPGGVCETNATVMSTTVSFPAAYSGWSSSEKALWLLNSERVARGLLPFTGTDAAVEQVAQAWAQNLADNGTFAHNGNRLAEIQAACTGCNGQVGNFPAENLASRSRLSYPTPAVLDGFGVESAIYNWMYEDRDGGGQFSDQFWGHRHALLWNNMNDDHGATGTEGFIGIGVAKVSISQEFNGLTYQGERELVVWNAIDSTSVYPAAPAAPATPTMSSPTGSGSTTPAFTWTDDGNATNFRLWVNDLTNGGTFHDAVYTTTEANCAAGTCSFTPAALTHASDNSYRVWVQAQNAVGNSAWSSSLAYDTYATTVPATPTPTAPNAAASLTPEFSWSEETGALQYRIWVNDLTNGGNVLNAVVTNAELTCAAGSCAFTSPGLTLNTNTRYRYWVQAQNFAGKSSWSAAHDFDTNATVLPPATNLIAPTGNTGSPSPTYSWDSVPEASWYYLWVNDQTGTPVKQWVSASDAGCSTGQLTCSITLPTPIIGNATWWVRTWNTVGWGTWSTSLSFTVVAPVG